MNRKFTSPKIKDKLNNGLLKAVKEFDKAGRKLSLQIRDNYCNIYYRGGNILRVRPVINEFDRFYFHINDTRPKKEVEKDKKIYVNERDELLNFCKNGSYNQFFKKASDQMDKWFENHPKDEREEQHNLIIANSTNDSEYYILDIEYAVSAKSKFKSENYNAPRFDIVAIDKSGQLWIFELKKGQGAIKGGSSDCKSHLDKFNDTLGGAEWKSFADEMEVLLKNKLELHIIDNINRCIKNEKPKFAFLYKERGNYSLDNLKAYINNEVNRCVGTSVFKISEKYIIEK